MSTHQTRTTSRKGTGQRARRPRTSLGILLGRIVSALRSETELNQIDFARKCRLSTGSLARVESGRNTATIDQLVSIERALRRLNVLDDAGDLTALVERGISALREHRIRVVSGKLEDEEDICPVSVVDRVVAKVVLSWQDERLEDEEDVEDDDDFSDWGDEDDDDDDDEG